MNRTRRPSRLATIALLLVVLALAGVFAMPGWLAPTHTAPVVQTVPTPAPVQAPSLPGVA